MTLRSDIARAKELDAKATPGSWQDEYKIAAHYRTLVPRLIAQMEAMEGALNALLIERGGMPKECGHFYECRCANDAARSALAALDKEEQ